MSLTSTVNRISYVSGAGQTTFAYPFTIYAATDLQVYDAGVLQTSGYTVTNVGIDGGGNVVFSVGRTAGNTILILRVEPADQQTVLPTSGPFPAKSVEKMSDKLTMLIQQLQEVDKRTLKLAVTSAFVDLLAPDPVTGKFLRWKDATTLENADITAGGTLGLPVGFADGGTGGSYASRAALAKGLALALWGDGSPTTMPLLTVTANVGQIPNPITSNTFRVSAGETLTGLTTAGVAAGTILNLYYLGAVNGTHSSSFFLMGATNAVYASDDISTFKFTGGGWIEIARFHLGTATNRAQFWRGDGTWASPVLAPGIAGLGLSNNAGDATNDIDVALGSTVSDDADPTAKVSMYLAAGITKQLDVNWAVGTNAGGLDTGAVGNGTYHVYLIKRPDTGVVDMLFSLSASAPTMPANYTKKQRIGSIIRAAGAILAFKQYRTRFDLVTPTLDVNNAAPGTSANTATLTVPTGINVVARLNVSVVDNAYWSALDMTDSAPSYSAAPLGAMGTNDAGTATGYTEVRTNTSAQVRYRVIASSLIVAATLGWRDEMIGVN